VSSRRLAVGTSVLALVVWPACTEGGARRSTTPERPPNVLVIVTDDQRAEGALDVMPRTRRWFGRGGTTYTQAFATTPLCCPSRASILTGRYSHNTGVEKNQDGPVLDQDSTIEAYLKEAGYKTALAGKFLQGLGPDFNPPHFDGWVTSSWGYYGATFNVNGEVRVIDRYSTDFVTLRASRFLRRFERDDRSPWLMYVAPVAPHKPYEAERKYESAAVPSLSADPSFEEKDRSDKPAFVERVNFSLPQARALHRAQLRTLKSVDDMVDRLFRLLGRLGERENTLAFFLSDNGFLLGEHRLFAKRVPYIPAVRIPMLARWPGHIPGGVRDDRLVANIDIAPTIYDATGVRPEPRFPVDGVSLLSDHARTELLIEMYDNWRHHIPDWASILTSSFQYVEYYQRSYERRGARVMFREYYDLESDPFELDNLLEAPRSAKRPELQSLSSRLESFRICEGRDCP
jgi:arylsulfatase A-like enzyme